MVMPVFLEGRLLAYTVSRAHWTDIGGLAPGGFSVAVWDIYSEGLRIPAVLVYRNYRPVEDVVKLIMANVRGAEERIWDLRGQFGACLVGQRAIHRLCAKYGVDTVAACMEAALDYSERRLRLEIEKIPDGAYRWHDYVEGDGWQDFPIKLQAEVRVKGSDVEVDYTGTDPQVRGGVNAPMSITEGVTLYVLKAVTDHTIPSNAGMERPLRVIAPEGTILNPIPPTACSTGGTAETAQRLADLLMCCFAQAIPERVIAGTYASSTVTMWSGRDPIDWRRKLLGRERVVVMDNTPGGMGARPNKDGVNGIKVHTGNAMVTPVEYLEFSAPIRVRRWEIETDTGGAGKFRGGCAAPREYEALFDMTTVTVLGERTKVAPFGLFGGRAGAVGQLIINPGRPGEQRLPSKNPPRILNRGDVLRYQPAGGGGYGDPTERPPDQVLEDVLNGYVSREGAKEQYGVVLDRAGAAVDAEATARLREAMRRDQQADGWVDRGEIGYEGVEVGT